MYLEIRGDCFRKEVMTFGDLVEDLMLLNSRLQVTHQHLGQHKRKWRGTDIADLLSVSGGGGVKLQLINESGQEKSRENKIQSQAARW